MELNQDFYRDLFDHSHELLCLHDLEGKILTVNPLPAKLLGYTVEELKQKSLRDLIDPNFRDQFDAYLHQIKHTGDAQGLMIMSTRTGELRAWKYHNTLRTEGVTNPVVRFIAHDVTERVQDLNHLEESSRHFQVVYERAPIGIASVDLNGGRFLQVNPKFCEICGRSEEEMLQLDVATITHPDDVERSNQFMLQNTTDTPSDCEITKRVLRPDGSVRWVRVLPVPMWANGDTLRWNVALIEDITDKRRAEEGLREREERFRLFVEHAPVELAMFDRDMRYLHASPRWRANYGLGDRELRGLSHYEVFPAIPERWREAHRRCLRGEVLREENDHFERADGSTQWIRWEILPWHDSAGVIGGLMIFTEDITERKRAEETVRLSEERFRVALKNSPITVFNQDRDLRYTWMYNPQLGDAAISRPEKTPVDFFGPDEDERISEVRRQVLETGVGTRYELPIAYAGKTRYFDTTIEPIFDSTGAVTGLTGASADVTELREANEALREATEKLAEEKVYLEREVDAQLGFGEIVGRSAALKSVMDHVATVAASDATVLLLGETGTGKELVARALHRLSHRSEKSFIKLNCAAIPSGLLESELFGNEKGAFTGAVSKKIGRLELADHGTLFLDEIGEIPLELQPKLLRVLQDMEFERLGSIQTLKVNFRLIAATNRDLGQAMKEKQFRSDLYYRLNVFPIRLPALRERKDDIPLLAQHYVEKFAKRMKKTILSIPKRTMDALIANEWPGNIRELENFLERSVILTSGTVLVSPLKELHATVIGTATENEVRQPNDSLASVEREHIVRALKESRGRISGINGAASRLGLKRTTLQSKIKYLGIDPRG